MIPINQEQFWPIGKPLAMFVAAMFVYGWFIFKFYRFLARKDVIELNLRQYNKLQHPLLEETFGLILYIIEYLILFPVFTFFWFAVLALLIAFLSENPVASQILLVAVALVGAVRIAAYYNEDLAQDLAKLLPLSLLGVLLVDISQFDFWSSIAVIKEMPTMWNTLFYYFTFIVLLELLLRIGYLVTVPFHGGKTGFEKDQEEYLELHEMD